MNNEKMNDDWKSVIEYIEIWYETYVKIMKYLGAICAGIMVFTTTVLFKEIFSGELLIENQLSLRYIKYSFILFGSALVGVFINLLATYNWFISGLDKVLKSANVSLDELGDDFSYRNKLGNMKLWGDISFYSGGVVGILILIGIILYTFGVADLISIALQINPEKI